jgi:hypothetical protein
MFFQDVDYETKLLIEPWTMSVKLKTIKLM